MSDKKRKNNKRSTRKPKKILVDFPGFNKLNSLEKTIIAFSYLPNFLFGGDDIDVVIRDSKKKKNGG